MYKIISIVCSVFFLSCNAQPSKNAKVLAPAAYAEKIKATPNAQILDVRTPAEFAGEHLDNAANVNWNGDNFEAEAAKFDKSKPVFVYCKIGGRSAQAAAKLGQMGFKEIYDLQGGIMKWNADGFAPKSDKIVGVCPQEFGEMLNTDKLVLVDFYADWCEPCKKMTPYLLKMTDEMKDKVTIIRLNADENKTMVADMKIESLPAIFIYKDKKIIWKHIGFISEDELKKQL
ncbi:MAG: redoxin domain-containing protein [Flavobacterium sp.]|nr:MAG: redoxin domain-containing protein [Flavobacterium sp.]